MKKKKKKKEKRKKKKERKKRLRELGILEHGKVLVTCFWTTAMAARTSI